MGYHLMFAAGFTDANGLTQHWGSCVSVLSFLDQVNNYQFNDNTCGITKGCFAPTDCKEGCNEIKASWTVLSPNQIHVELAGKTDKLNNYVAMGFSTNSQMGNASVIDCSSFNNQPYSLSFSYNQVGGENYANLRPSTDISSLFTNQHVQFVDGYLYCSADVQVSGNANDLTVFKYDDSADYSIVLATGATDGTTKGLKYHSSKRSVAPSQKLNDYSTPTAAPPSGSVSLNFRLVTKSVKVSH